VPDGFAFLIKFQEGAKTPPVPLKKNQMTGQILAQESAAAIWPRNSSKMN
jgi:hypothetical protein